MNENKEKKTPKTHSNSIEPGHPDYKPGETGIPDVAVMDEDAKSELEHEKTQPKQDTDDEERKVVNEQEQDQVVNDDMLTFYHVCKTDNTLVQYWPGKEDFRFDETAENVIVAVLRVLEKHS